MLFRKATMMDLAKLGDRPEVGEDAVIEWMRHSKNSENVCTVVGVRHQSLKAYMMSSCDGEVIAVLRAWTGDDFSKDILQALMRKTIKHFTSVFEKEPKGFWIEGSSGHAGEMESLGFHPVKITWIKELGKDGLEKDKKGSEEDSKEGRLSAEETTSQHSNAGSEGNQ